MSPLQSESSPDDVSDAAFKEMKVKFAWSVNSLHIILCTEVEINYINITKWLQARYANVQAKKKDAVVGPNWAAQRFPNQEKTELWFELNVL